MRSLLAIPLTIAGLCAFGSVALADFNVVNNGITSFRIDGVDNPTLTLNQGSTYTFNVNAIGHPFYIKTVRITGSGSQFTNGVTGNGVQTGTLTFDVPLDAPSSLFHPCGVRSGMGGNITILGPVDVSIFDARGRRMRTLWRGAMTAGQHSLAWDGLTDALGAAPSGAYFYRMRVEGRTLTGRLILTR